MRESGCGGGSVFRYPRQYDCPSGETRDNPSVYTGGLQGLAHRYCVGFSRDSEDLIFAQMQSDVRRLFTIEIEGFNRVLNVRFKLFPGIALGKDILAEGFGYESSIGFLRDFEDKFAHTDTIR